MSHSYSSSSSSRGVSLYGYNGTHAPISHYPFSASSPSFPSSRKGRSAPTNRIPSSSGGKNRLNRRRPATRTSAPSCQNATISRQMIMDYIASLANPPASISDLKYLNLTGEKSTKSTTATITKTAFSSSSSSSKRRQNARSAPITSRISTSARDIGVGVGLGRISNSHCNLISTLHGSALHICPRLTTLILKNNCISTIASLEHNPELWHIDLCNNNIKELDGLKRFTILGSLQLAGNRIEYDDLRTIAHIQIVDLSLFGNPIENDPNYRRHVIDILPNIWILDGKPITGVERADTKRFFDTCASTGKIGCRRKFSGKRFQTSAMRKINVTGLFGSKAVHLRSRFPVQCRHTRDIDLARLTYYLDDLQDEITLETQHSPQNEIGNHNSQPSPDSTITNLMACDSRENRNMLLILLAASLEFAIPAELMRQTLEMVNIDKVQNINTMDYFRLPAKFRSRLLSILLAVHNIDVQNGYPGGIYPRLRKCLEHVAHRLSRLARCPNRMHPLPPKSKPGQVVRKANHLNCVSHFSNLLSQEVAQLLCLVPGFPKFISDKGISEILIESTGDPNIEFKLREIIISSFRSEESSTSDSWDFYKKFTSFLFQKIQNNPKGKLATNAISTTSTARKSRRPFRPVSGVRHSNSRKHIVEIGSVLSNRGRRGRVIAFLDETVVLVQYDEGRESFKGDLDVYENIQLNYFVWSSTQGLFYVVSPDSEPNNYKPTLHTVDVFELPNDFTGFVVASKPFIDAMNQTRGCHDLKTIEELREESGRWSKIEKCSNEQVHMRDDGEQIIYHKDTSTSSTSRAGATTPEPDSNIFESHVWDNFSDSHKGDAVITIQRRPDTRPPTPNIGEPQSRSRPSSGKNISRPTSARSRPSSGRNRPRPTSARNAYFENESFPIETGISVTVNVRPSLDESSGGLTRSSVDMNSQASTSMKPSGTSSFEQIEVNEDNLIVSDGGTDVNHDFNYEERSVGRDSPHNIFTSPVSPLPPETKPYSQPPHVYHNGFAENLSVNTPNINERSIPISIIGASFDEILDFGSSPDEILDYRHQNRPSSKRNRVQSARRSPNVTTRDKIELSPHQALRSSRPRTAPSSRSRSTFSYTDEFVLPREEQHKKWSGFILKGSAPPQAGDQ
eukprot:UC4_evm2s1043